MLSEAQASVRERPEAKPAGIWMGGRAVEGTGLENRQGRKSFVGSNPTPSAIALNPNVSDVGLHGPLTRSFLVCKSRSCETLTNPMLSADIRGLVGGRWR